MFETILKAIADYIAYIIMVIGCEEFIKRCIPKNIPFLNEIMQVVLCLIGSAHYVLKTIDISNTIDFISTLIYIWLLLISTTTLFYDLIIKKVKKGSDVEKEQGTTG